MQKVVTQDRGIEFSQHFFGLNNKIGRIGGSGKILARMAWKKTTDGYNMEIVFPLGEMFLKNEFLNVEISKKGKGEKMFKRIISYGLILAGVLSISSFEVVKASEDKRLAANSSFSISDNRQYQKLYGKDFWLVVYYQPENWAKAGMEKEPFLVESCYRIPFPDKGTSLYKKLLSMDNPIMLGRRTMTEFVFDEFKKDFKERYLCTAQLLEWTWMCDPNKVWKRLTEKYNVPMPETRKAAHELLFRGNVEDGLHGKCIGLHDYPGHKMYVLDATFQQHIEGASDLVRLLGPEIGTHSNFCSPIQISFSRGASRQYQKPWVSYIACYTNGATSFNVPHPRCRVYTYNSFCPYAGPSWSQGKRLLYLSYMGGASLIMHESDRGGIFSANYDYKTIDNVDSLVLNLRDRRWYISPIGAYWKEIYDKVHKKHNRGIPYTPIGLLFDQYHGYIHNSYGYCYDYCLGLIPFTDVDYMGRAIINILYPWEKEKDGERKTLPPGPLTGDIFDAVTNTSSLSNLMNYPVIFTSGNVDIDKEFAKKLIKYVREGGTLFINTSQQIEHFSQNFLGVKLTEEKCKGSSFKSLLDNSLVVEEEDKFSFQKIIPATAKVLVVEPESGFPLVTENVYGAHGGKLILTTPDYLYVKGSENRMLKLFPYLIRKISCELLPFSLEGEVEYLVNKTKNSIIITILNNKVTKAPLEKAVVKPEDTEKVRITFKRKEKRIKKGKEWLSGERIPMSGSIFKVTVPAGEVRIVEFRK